ncbi:bacillithiol system redox-active protein YtxJ [Sphingobacterium sp. SRCM116780]|uniref:bacillithiol system redox-active protein YtxJ n=1 Tax=Sphingobacterium sp. SRCM116780 TaxID=2907623 RepID=UPI001F1BF947|nr:bacillithiol system redox-active protein YtxJ [Sphingobacterium sp. SRCM116780]UIR55595.1 bacillithiol system redox-active protein YtxJ [Sphingobacterium sp. SRCM116780]
MINWIPLTSLDQLQGLLNNQQVSAIFKHSTSCGISGMAKRNLERFANLADKPYDVYYLDLLAFREISNQIAQIWQVEHQSPQLLIVKGNSCLFDASHGEIDFDDIVNYLK